MVYQWEDRVSVNVLIGEHEAGMQACRRFLMKRENHSFSIAKDGAEAMAILDGREPDLALLAVEVANKMVDVRKMQERF